MTIDEPIRINKYLSAAGFCSRRRADSLIDEGRVTIDGKIALKGTMVTPEQIVYVDGIPVENKDRKDILLLVNKPKGIVCTAQSKEENNIIDFLNYPRRIYPVGRLDKDSRGLILMTNVGELHNEITSVSNMHEKEYIVTVNKRIDAGFIKNMSEGVYLKDLEQMTLPAQVKKLSERTMSIVLHEGKNRQIRRMCNALSYRVLDLKRIRIMHFLLDGIEEGSYREATQDEWERLGAKFNKPKDEIS